MRARMRRCLRCRRRIRVRKSGGLWLHFARPGVSTGYCAGSSHIIASKRHWRTVDNELRRLARRR